MSTCSKSHSSTQVTGGTSRCARAMCSAITRRTPRSGSRRPSAAVPTTDPAAARTSSSVIRPCGPVPCTCSMSTPSSSAILRTTGVARARALGGPAGLVCGASTAAGVGGSAAGGSRVAADHDEHRADRNDLALGHEDARRRRRPQETGSRPSPCPSGSRRAGRPRRSPRLRRRATGRPRPPSGPRRDPAA